jgi:hypothetical protein
LAVSLESGQWQSISQPAGIALTNVDAHLAFEVPSTGSIHYLFTPSALSQIRGTLVVSVAVATTGPVLFHSLDPVSGGCVIPPSVRPFFWANGNGEGPYDRWWSNPRASALAAGTATISVPLTPGFWSSVNGQFGNADSGVSHAFETALLNVTRLGVTFGGGCSFGHGVNVSGGQAQFAITRFAIQ